MREAESEPQVETLGGRAGQEAQREVRGQRPQGPETGKYQEWGKEGGQGWTAGRPGA